MQAFSDGVIEHYASQDRSPGRRVRELARTFEPFGGFLAIGAISILAIHFDAFAGSTAGGGEFFQPVPALFN